MIIANIKDLVSAALSGCGFKLDQDGHLHTEEQPQSPEAAAGRSGTLSPGRREILTESRQALQRRMVDLAEASVTQARPGGSGLPASPWASLPLADYGMSSRDIAADIVKSLLLWQTGPNVDPFNPVVRELLERAVANVPMPSTGNKDLFLCCAAAALARESVPQPRSLESFRELVEQSTESTFLLWQNTVFLSGENNTLDPWSPLVEGAIEYFTACKSAADPGTAAVFRDCFMTALLVEPVDTEKSFQAICEKVVAEVEQGILAGRILQPRQQTPSGDQAMPGPSLPPLAPQAPIVQPSPPPSAAPQFLPVQPPHMPGDQIVQPSPMPGDPSVQPSPQFLPAQPPHIPGDPSAQPAQVPSHLPVPGDPSVQSMRQLLPAPAINIADPALQGLVGEVVANAAAFNVPCQDLLRQYLFTWLMDPDTEIAAGDMRSALERSCMDFQLQLLLESPELELAVITGFVRQQTAQILAQRVHRHVPSIPEEIVSFYARYILDEAIQAGGDIPGILQIVEDRLSLAVFQLVNVASLALDDGRLNINHPVVLLAVEFFTGRHSEGKDLNKCLVRDVTRSLLQGAPVAHLERPLLEVVSGHAAGAVRAAEDSLSGYTGITGGLPGLVCYAHALNLLPEAQKCYPYVPEGLLKSTIFCVLSHIAPTYEGKTLRSIEKEFWGALNTALGVQNLSLAEAFPPAGGPVSPGISGALLYGIRNALQTYPAVSPEWMRATVERVLELVPAAEVRLTAAAFTEYACMQTGQVPGRAAGEVSGERWGERYIALMLRARLLLDGEPGSFPVPPELRESMAYTAASVLCSGGPGVPDIDIRQLRAVLEEIVASNTDPARARGTDGQFNPDSPGVLAAIDCVRREIIAAEAEVSPVLLHRVLSDFLRETPVGAVTDTLLATVRNCAYAVVPVLRGHTMYQSGEYRREALIQDYVRGLFHANRGTREVGGIHPGFYQSCVGGRLLRNGMPRCFAASGASEQELNRAICRMRRMVQNQSANREVRYLLSLLSSVEGSDPLARVVLESLPEFRNFITMLDAGWNFIKSGNVHWDKFPPAPFTLRHSYELGFFVKNPLTGVVQKIQTAVLHLGIEFNLAQAVDRDELPEFQVLKVVVQPGKSLFTLPSPLRAGGVPASPASVAGTAWSGSSRWSSSGSGDGDWSSPMSGPGSMSSSPSRGGTPVQGTPPDDSMPPAPGPSSMPPPSGP